MTTRKSRSKSVQLGQVAVLLVAGLVLTGCRSTAYERSDATARSLRSAAAEVQAENRALEVTLTALNELVNQPSGDLKPQFRVFSSSLDGLIDAADRTRATGTRVQERSVDYFEAWDKQLADMNYEYVRKSSEARRGEVATRFESITQRYKESEEAMQPLIAYLVDIRKALSADLTPGGLAAVKSIVANAQDNAARVQTVLAKLTTDLADSGNKMSSVAVESAHAETTIPAPTPPPNPTSDREQQIGKSE